MASNFEKWNGDHKGDQDVRSKTFSNQQRPSPARENYNMNQSYTPSGAGLPTEMENPTDTRNQSHSTPTDMFSRRQNQFPPLVGNASTLPNKRLSNKRNPVPDMPDQYPTDFRSSNMPSDYSTSEQVQNLTSQIHLLFQEIREIKGFAGLISDINFKLEQVMEQNNDIRDVVDDIQFDVGTMKKQTLQHDTVRNDRMHEEVENVRTPPEIIQTNIIQTNPQRSSLQGYPKALPFTNVSSRDIQPGPNSPVTIQNGEDSENRMHLSQDRSNLSSGFEVKEKESLMQDCDDSLVTMEKERPPEEDKRRTEYERDTIAPSVVNDTQKVSVTEVESNTKDTKKISVGTEMSLQTIDQLRRYKCKKTLESEDNRLNDPETDPETDPTPVVRVAPQPRPRSPEDEQTDVEETPHDNDRIEEVPEIVHEGDIAVLKEDQYLEHLALTENNKAKDCLDPKSNGADTVICIDTSESMAGEPFRKCIEFINQFVDYVEQWAEKYQIEENIAIVRFGHEARIIQHVTNDYNKVRDALEKLSTGGPTPMMTGLVISMSALFNRGGPVTVHDRQVNPRVILLSDGKATDHRIFEGPDVIQPNGLTEPKIKEKLVDFAERVQLENRYFISIPVGNNPKMEILNPLAEITGGFVSSLENVKKLSRAFFVEVMISQTRYDGITDDIKTNRHEIAAITRNLPFGRDVTEAEMNEVVTRVIKETEEQIEIDRQRELQRMEIDEESDMEAGLRVRRGKDWMWGDQDGFGTGTVIGHKSRGYVRVKWDCGNVGRYRHGAQNAYDLYVVDEPRMLPEDVLIAEGVYVIKGKDWEWHDQDGGGEDAVGCVYYFEDEGIVHVRWENGIRGNYRFGGFGKIDLQILTPRDYERLKIKRQRKAEQEAEYQAHGYATSQNIQTDGPTSPNIQTDGPSSPKIEMDGLTNFSIPVAQPNIQTDGPSNPKIEMDGFTNSSTPVAQPNISNSQTPGPNISNVQSEESIRPSQHKSEDSSYIKPETTKARPVDSSAETNESEGVWQYCLNNQWTDFTDTDNDRIEKMYNAKKSGTLVIKNNQGENCRILLNRMKHKNTKTAEEIDIRRKEKW